jgi:hypothetical protein
MRRPQLVIVEGTDGTGKSTLAKQWAELHDAPLKHYGVPTQGFDAEYMDDIIDFSQTGEPLMIHDRGFIGEPVWAALRHREPLLPAYDIPRRLDQVHFWVDLTVVVLDRKPHQIIHELTARGEADTTGEVLAARRQYDGMVKLLRGLRVQVFTGELPSFADGITTASGLRVGGDA